ncbi:hypothetical protein GCM10018790_58630 [Kitasatospora xanthocidica]|nr:hypothetical protein GCM10018790_58630 [Kitasatospora xanthocidica]
MARGVWQGWCLGGGLWSWWPVPAFGATPTPTWTSTPTPTSTPPPGPIETSVPVQTQMSTPGPCGCPPPCSAPAAVAPVTSAHIATTPTAAPISRALRPEAAVPPPCGGIRRNCRRWDMGSTHLSGRLGERDWLGWNGRRVERPPGRKAATAKGRRGNRRRGRHRSTADRQSIGYDQK